MWKNTIHNSWILKRSIQIVIRVIANKCNANEWNRLIDCTFYIVGIFQRIYKFNNRIIAILLFHYSPTNYRWRTKLFSIARASPMKIGKFTGLRIKKVNYPTSHVSTAREKFELECQKFRQVCFAVCTSIARLLSTFSPRPRGSAVSVLQRQRRRRQWYTPSGTSFALATWR